jgi:hypothetical protein
VTEISSDPGPKRASRTPAAPDGSKPARKPRAPKTAPIPAPEPTHRHPSLGLAPLDLTAGFPAAAEVLRRDKAAIAAAALEALDAADPDFRGRFDEVGMRRLLADAEVLIDRLALSVAANDPRPMAQYAEWIDPIFRRRRVSLWDLAALCGAIKEVATSRLDEGAAAAMNAAMDAAIGVLRKNGRLAGDMHGRNALLKWLYKGV